MSKLDELLRLNSEFAWSKPHGLIYALKAGRFIKIGWTKNNVSGRMRLLATGCPYDLKVVLTVPGTVEHERAVMRRLRDHRVRPRAEWFRDHKDVRSMLGAVLLAAKS